MTSDVYVRKTTFVGLTFAPGKACLSFFCDIKDTAAPVSTSIDIGLPSIWISTRIGFVDELPTFLGAVNTTGEQDDWRVTVSLRKEDVEFKLDTGAEVDAISEATYKTLGCPRLCKPSRILYGPAKQPVEVLG